MIILGIDPGTTRMGYGLIRCTPRLEYIDCGVIGDEKSSSVNRLLHIGSELEKMIDKYRPNFIGVERIFFSKNKTTAVSVAEARGVILFIAGKKNIPIFEFSPTEIKSAVAGDGTCSKDALSRVVAMTLGVDKISGYDDASDALATAIRVSFEPEIKQG